MAAGHDDATEIIGLEDTVAATAGEEVAQRLLRPFRLRASHGRRLGHPMTTDIAFSPGMLALLGSRVPDALKIFLVASPHGADRRGSGVSDHAHLAPLNRADRMRDVLRRPMEDGPGRVGARVALGRSQAGRYLRVIYVPDTDPDSVFVITAYPLGPKAMRALRRRRRRKS